MVETFSLYKFTHFENIQFDKTEYSFFKYGSIKSSASMGRSLGKAFCEEVLDKSKFSINDDFLVFPSSYGFIPSAANLMKDYFLLELNKYVQTKGINKTFDSAKIQRYTHYQEDYASLSYEERVKITSNDKFYIDAEFVKGKTLVFIDDIKITGRHEELIEETLRRQGLSGVKRIHVYYAELLDKTTDPNIESKLNTCINPSIELLKVLKTDGVVFNTRFIKFVLKNIKNTIDFLHYFDMHHCSELYQKSISEGYGLYPQYKENLDIINQLLNNK